jgi:gliding motility-associated-like protein
LYVNKSTTLISEIQAIYITYSFIFNQAHYLYKQRARCMFIRYLILLFTLFISGSVQLKAQDPFVCRGDVYMVLRRDGDINALQRVVIDPVTRQVRFSHIADIPEKYNLNAMGYRVTDNLIYAINVPDQTLVRIDSNGIVQPLRMMTEISQIDYFSADITPDGNYLVISGTQGNIFTASNVNLVFIDLTNPGYQTREFQLTLGALFFDMAFDPFTGRCYAYDTNFRQLVRIDINSGAYFRIGAQFQLAGNLASLFFDPFGNLFGYGTPAAGNSQTSLYEINKTTGMLKFKTFGSVADRTDGCSCPYTIKLQKDVLPREAVLCSEVTYSFVVSNASGIVRRGLELRDFLPSEFRVLEILRNPFNGNLTSSLNSNKLTLENMTVHLGLDTIVIKVLANADLPGTYYNQAQLLNLPEALGSVALSDDPLTLVQEDSTSIDLVSLDVDLLPAAEKICYDGSLKLTASSVSSNILWSTGSTEREITITQPGTFWVRAANDCGDYIYDTIFIETAPEIEISLPQEIEIGIGDSIKLSPRIRADEPVFYLWSTEKAEAISCIRCKDPYVDPLRDTEFEIQVTDGYGCIASETILIRVNRDIYIYIPNAFSPNGDGTNDYFFPMGKSTYPLRDFSIFDRWGNRLFLRENLKANQELQGWNGYSGSEPALPGVYVWVFEFVYEDGERRVFSGDVTLIR